MAKSKKTIEITGGKAYVGNKNSVDIIMGDEPKPYVIKGATIKDDFLNFSFEVLQGVCRGDIHSVKGSGIILKEVHQAFEKLNVHLACIDDAFKNAGIEVDDIDKFHSHDLTMHYSVEGFKIKGNQENGSIILIGKKYVGSAIGRIAIESPKIPLDNLSSYKWYNELKELADKARHQVELYKEGNRVPVEEEEETPNPKQMTIGDALEGEEEDAFGGKKMFIPGGFQTMPDNDHEFEKAKV